MEIEMNECVNKLASNMTISIAKMKVKTFSSLILKRTKYTSTRDTKFHKCVPKFVCVLSSIGAKMKWKRPIDESGNKMCERLNCLLKFVVGYRFIGNERGCARVCANRMMAIKLNEWRLKAFGIKDSRPKQIGSVYCDVFFMVPSTFYFYSWTLNFEQFCPFFSYFVDMFIHWY